MFDQRGELESPEALVQIRNLKTYFYTYEGVVRALEGIDLDIYKGETLGLVGETGCGKSVTALSIMRLVPNPPGRIVDGQIMFKGEDLLRKSESEMQAIRGNEITMVFQDPLTFINPVLTIGDQVSEVIMLHEDLNRASAGRQDQRAAREDETRKLAERSSNAGRAN